MSREQTKESTPEKRETICITIQGHPVAKARARTVRTRSGKVVSYTPGKTRRWEQGARLQAQACMTGKAPMTGPVELRVHAALAVPTSWPEWKREAALSGRLVPTAKPDLDNIVKAAKDAMNGIIWLDDAQVVGVTASKTYSAIPRVDIVASAVSAAPSQISRKADMRTTTDDGGKE